MASAGNGVKDTETVVSDGEEFVVEGDDDEVREERVSDSGKSVGSGIGPSGEAEPGSQRGLDGRFKWDSAIMEKLAFLTDQLAKLQMVPSVHSASDDAGQNTDGEEDVADADDSHSRDATKNSCVKGADKNSNPSGDQVRGVWDWDRTEALLMRCLKTGGKGVLPTISKGRESARVTDVFDAQMAVQWVRRMEQLRGNVDPLPMRGPFVGKLPTFKKLQENPVRMTALPLSCDLKLSPDEKAKTDHRPYRLGNPSTELLSDRAYQAWQTRSEYLKQFEVLSLQLERVAALQTVAICDLAAALKQKENTGSAEVRALFSDVTPRLNDLRCLNDLMLNRTELLAYSTYKASKCIYLEALGLPKEEWGQLIMRKWGAADLFDGRDATVMKQKMARMPPPPSEPVRRPPLLYTPMQCSEPPRPIPQFFHEHPRGPMPMHPMPPHPSMMAPQPPPFMMDVRQQQQQQPQHQRWNPNPNAGPMGGYPPLMRPRRQLYDPHASSGMGMGGGMCMGMGGGGGGLSMGAPRAGNQPRPLVPRSKLHSARQQQTGVGMGKGAKEEEKPGKSGAASSNGSADSGGTAKKAPPSSEEAAVLVNQIESLLNEVMMSAKETGLKE